MCIVALFAIATMHMLRATVALAVRLSVATIMAATAFSFAVVVAERVADYRAQMPVTDGLILSEIVTQPVYAADNSDAVRMAAVMNPQTSRE